MKKICVYGQGCIIFRLEITKSMFEQILVIYLLFLEGIINLANGEWLREIQPRDVNR